MNGFRIWTPADKWLDLHTKRHTRAGAKSAATLFLAVPLLVSMSGCGKKTPVYAGPPDTVLHIVMKKWEIVPSRIEVPQDAKVELIVTTADIEHGIAVPGLGINEPVQPGRVTGVRFLAQTPGVYPMHCSILCGRGHDKMTGEIVIEANPLANAPGGE